MKPLKLPKLNKSSVLVFIIAIFVFFEIVIMSPEILEKKDTDAFSNEGEIALMNEDSKNVIEQKMQGVHLVENAENEKGWELFATGAVGTASGQWVLKNVKVQFFSKNLLSYIVTGDVGEIDGTNKDMLIRGNVTTQSENGYSFKTETIRYIAKQKIMTSVDDVLMNGPADANGTGFKLTGEKLLVEMSKNKMSILDNIVADKVIDDKKFHLTSQRADFSNKSKEAVFTGEVAMNLGTTFVKAPMAVFQYSNTKKMLEKILMNDKVEFSDEDKKGFCTELEFDLTENKMTMRGQPKVLQGDDEIKGHEIVFLEGGKKVRINKATNQGIKK